MVAKAALDWAAAPPKHYAILDISDRRPNERSKPQTIFVLTFNRNSRGPGMLHVLDRTGEGWRTLLRVSFDPARQEISVGDARPPGDEEFSVRRLRLFSIDPIIHAQASQAKTQQQIMKLAGYEGRWSWQPLPDRQKKLDAMFDNADGPLWLWTGKGFKRIPAGAAREQFEDQWRGSGMFCGTLP